MVTEGLEEHVWRHPEKADDDTEFKETMVNGASIRYFMYTF
jgi:hypothetical protein